MDYQPISSLPPARSGPAKAGPSSESAYWRRFRNPTFIKEFAPISHVSFVPAANAFSEGVTVGEDGAPTSAPSSSGFATSSQARARYAVTSGPRVQIYSARTNRVLKTITRFGDVARSAEIRADGRLIVAGDDSGKVQVFDINSRAILRSFANAHKLPVHVTKFSTRPTTILSASDDSTVKLHDIPSTSTTNTFDNHTDYVRSALVSPDNPSLILSGSYDQTVRLWDSRASENGGQVMEMNHGAPVESTLIYPTGGGGIAVSAGGPIVKVWDLMMGGRTLKAVSNHQKTITSLALSMQSGAEGPNLVDSEAGGMRLLSAGLDGLVKVYDPAKDYRVVHTMRYSSPILSLAISPEERDLAVGMADGTLCVRKRQVSKTEEESRAIERNTITGGGMEAFLNAQENVPSAALTNSTSQRDRLLKNDDIRAETVRSKKLKPYDKLMKAFKYSEALDAVLRPGIPTTTTFALLLELKRRSSVSNDNDGLKRALGGRDDVSLEPILKFLLRHADNPIWIEMVCDILSVILDLYSSTLGLSPLTDSLFSRLWAKITDEVKLQDQVQGVRGGLEMLLNRSLIGRV
ncbi:unnamed protein product [Sympodiomycopsis kandeliae]